MPSSSQEPGFLVDRLGIVIEINQATALLFGGDRARVGTPCYKMVAGRSANGTSICRADCEYLQFDPNGTRPSPRDVIVTAPDPDGRAGTVDLELSLRHVPIDTQGQRSVLHLLDDVTSRRRRERIGARLERLRDGAPVSGGLTQREVGVLRLVADGLPTPQIATRLGIGTSTARNHVARILEKLGAANRPSALIRFLLGVDQEGRAHSARPRTRRRRTSDESP